MRAYKLSKIFENQKVVKIFIDFPSKYSGQTSFYIKFKYFGIQYLNFYVIYCFYFKIFEKFKIYINFKILK